MRRIKSTADKTLFQGLTVAIFGCLFAGCGDGQSVRSGFEPGRESVVQPSGATTQRPTQARPADWGDDWRGSDRSRTAGTRDTTGRRPASARSGQPTTIWTLVLQTFSQEGHRRAAATMAQELRTAAPQLAEARVHTTTSGSMVVYGNYQSAKDPAAQRDKKAVKQIMIHGRKAFPRAMLTRLRLQPAPGTMHPFALMSLRQLHPKVDPLYTLQVAVWGDFDSGKLTLEQIHRAAVAYATELRVQNFEAFFHHDDDRQLSIVTIGVFDRRAIDPQTGFFSPEVDTLLRRFPAHLVNGEPLLEIKNRRDPRRSKQPQTPRLVEVPTL